ncbi:hypothetical protein PT974_10126 [Cladobotryum mycophilum]|uniref:Uncharacterized protein n=1 Tax=Cladobotryum mycophilum TaxID=491253 RepID=A0ABR0SA32_9HYPO
MGKVVEFFGTSPYDDHHEMEPPRPEMRILYGPRDWDAWRNQTLFLVARDVREHLLADKPPKRLACPRPPSFKDIEPTAAGLADLTPKQLRALSRLGEKYKVDKDLYHLQDCCFKKARKLIWRSVSREKRRLLRPKSPLRDWMKSLERYTAPSNTELLGIAREDYQRVMRQFPPISLHRWADEWLAVVSQCYKYNLPEAHSGFWLRDMAMVMEPYDALLSAMFLIGADELDAAAMQWRKEAERAIAYREAHKARDRCRGGERGNQLDPDQEVEVPCLIKLENRADQEETLARWSFESVHDELLKHGYRLRKRKEEAEDEDEEKGFLPEPPSKKACYGCRACGMRNHSLDECWYVFVEKKPPGRPLNNGRFLKVVDAIEMDAELERKIMRIRRRNGI